MSLKRTLLSLIAVGFLFAVVMVSWTLYDAWQLGVLPWQPEPTRVVVTPFADLPTVVSTPGS